jgi:hypothetical protein
MANKRVKRTKEEKRERPHFNVIDALIVILLIGVVAGVYFRYSIIDLLKNSSADEQYAVSYSIENVRYTTPSYINVNDEVYFSADGQLMGKIISVSENNNDVLSVRPASKSFIGADGTLSEVFYPEDTRVSATGRMLCKGSYDSSVGFCIDGKKYISAGQSVEIYTDFVTLTVTITAIEPYAEK